MTTFFPGYFAADEGWVLVETDVDQAGVQKAPTNSAVWLLASAVAAEVVSAVAAEAAVGAEEQRRHQTNEVDIRDANPFRMVASGRT